MSESAVRHIKNLKEGTVWYISDPKQIERLLKDSNYKDVSPTGQCAVSQDKVESPGNESKKKLEKSSN
jgi:hypothetical protein